jgi:erythromycin esterase
MRLLFIILVGCVTISAQGIQPADDSGQSKQFSAWATKSLHPLASNSGRLDLAPLKQMIGSARIVALSEAVHAGAEPLLFRNRLLEFLVEEMGFTAIAIESGFTEGQMVYDYVLGGPGDIKSVTKMGLSWTFGNFPQNEALIAWLREYNASPKHSRKVRFYGFDVPGSPGNGQANRGLKTAIEAALDYLAKVDSPAAGELRRRTEPLMPFLNVRARSTSVKIYSQLPPVQRDQLTSAVADMVALFERRATDYTKASSAEAYRWAYHNAICARQGDNWLRQIPPGWEPHPKNPDIALQNERDAVRDRAMADNLRWIEDQEGPQGKILVFASRFHIATARYLPVMAGTPGPGDPVGRYLREEMGAGLVNIGNFVGGGSAACSGFEMEVEVPDSSFDKALGSVTMSDFLLDLRRAPSAIKSWLDQPKILYFPPDHLRIPILQAFDIVYFTHVVTRACPKEK